MGELVTIEVGAARPVILRSYTGSDKDDTAGADANGPGQHQPWGHGQGRVYAALGVLQALIGN